MRERLEWDEEIPQPKPPTRRTSLWVKSDGLDDRPATLADIARALGLNEAHLAAFVRGETAFQQGGLPARATKGNGQ